MRAGELDRRVTWEVSIVSKDATGNDSRTWSPLFTTWCRKAQLSGAEYVASVETVNEDTVKIELYWRDGVSTTDRFLFEGRTWNVQTIAELGRREGLAVVGRSRADGLPIEGHT